MIWLRPDVPRALAQRALFGVRRVAVDDDASCAQVAALPAEASLVAVHGDDLPAFSGCDAWLTGAQRRIWPSERLAGLAPPPSRARSAVAIVRVEGSGGHLDALLETHGVAPATLALLRTVRLPVTDQARQAFEAAVWGLFTSAAAVRHAAAALAGARPPGKLAAVGEATAAAMRSVGWQPALVADGSGAAALAAEVQATAAPRSRMVWPTSAAADGTLQVALAQAGHVVTRLDLYAPDVVRPGWLPWMQRAFAEGRVRVTAFYSPSGADAFWRLFGGCAHAVAVGGSTAARLRTLGCPHVRVADTPAAEDVTRAVLNELEE